jgi:hypothetical protein
VERQQRETTPELIASAARTASSGTSEQRRLQLEEVRQLQDADERHDPAARQGTRRLWGTRAGWSSSRDFGATEKNSSSVDSTMLHVESITLARE